MSQNAISQMLGSGPNNLLELRLTGLLIGAPLGILAAVPLFALAQLTDLIIRVERNTRLNKELTYYLLTEGKVSPSK